MRTWIVTIALFILPLASQAEDGEKSRPWPLKVIMGLKTFVDSSAVDGLDRRYVGQPTLPWSAELRTDINNSDLDMEAKELEIEEIDHWGLKTHSGPTLSVGAWAGYRGYGFGLSRAIVGGGDIKSFAIGATGGSYGINLRIKQYKSNTPTVRVEGDFGDGRYYEEMEWETEEPLNMKSLFLDVYYMFNRKRFSYAAAYDQSLQQLRSAGTLVAGMMYYQSQVKFEDKANYMIQSMMGHIGRLKFAQASVGAGYAYNWVPAHGWLINVMGVPMVTFYNHVKSYTYSVEYGDTEKGEDPYWVKPSGEHKYNGQISLNFDVRMSVSYQWRRYYLRAYSHYNHFRYHKDSNHGHTSDWTVYSAFGVRF